jgi:hypothetical protein
MTNSSKPPPIPELLPDDLLGADGGHASDVVLTALADGQSAIVPEAVRAHVERCSTCTVFLGNAALLSLHVDRQLAVRAEHDRVLARRPLPRLAIALGLVVAALGLLPSILDGSEASAFRSFATRDAPLFLRSVGALTRHLDQPGSFAGLLVTYATAVILVAMGFAVVHLLPKKETSR